MTDKQIELLREEREALKGKFPDDDIVSEDELTDMFGEGGKEEIKEYYRL